MSDLITIRPLTIDRPDWPHAARSAYVEQFWLPILGPTATLLLRLGAGVRDETTLPSSHVAQALGVNAKVLSRACHRLTGFHGSVWYEDTATLVTYSHLAWLPPRLLDRLPAPLRAVHDQMDRAA